MSENKQLWRTMLKTQEKNDKKIEFIEFLMLNLVNPNYMKKQIHNDD